MNSGRTCFRSLWSALSAAVLLLVAGCSNPFIVKHKVLVDAIAAPGVTKPNGASYRLVAKRAVVNQAQAQVAVVKACVDAALSGHGMYEAPPNVPPDLVIEVTYGVDTTSRVDPASRETFVHLSARSNPGRSLDRATGPEVWDVRVGVLGVTGRMENALPLLCAVAADYMGTDTKMETKIDVPQNSPLVKAVRETAIKSLEQKAAPGNAPAASGSGGGAAGAAPAGAK